ncbi:MAG: hypothetical protein M0P71_17045 [Melioribacteraceae bacterium]|jgi:hypothetical protein|nr:hypothetical protein [Melioribacteraceae bacterium]
MNRDIDDTIKEITLSIIQFDTDIKTIDPDGINKFINDFERLYEILFIDYKYNESEFKKEVQKIFEYLFSDEKIFDYAFRKFKDEYGAIPMNSELNPLLKKIYDIRTKHTPFDWSVVERFRPDPVKEFVSKYQERYKTNEVEKKYPDKFYAWYHGILIKLGKETNFPANFGKKEIIEFGKNRYRTGEGFYKVISKLDLNKSYTFVKSMTKERATWKTIIKDISGNNADVIDYLNKFEN